VAVQNSHATVPSALAQGLNVRDRQNRKRLLGSEGPRTGSQRLKKINRKRALMRGL